MKLAGRRIEVRLRGLLEVREGSVLPKFNKGGSFAVGKEVNYYTFAEADYLFLKANIEEKRISKESC